MDLDVAFKGREHDDAGLREFGPDGDQGVDTAQIGEPQVHQRDVRPVLAILLNGFVPAGCLRDDLHVRLAVNNRCDPLPQEGMIIHAEHPNANLIVHLRVSPLRRRGRNRWLNQEGLTAASSLNAICAGTVSCTSVPAAALLITWSRAPIRSARSRMPDNPQCPSRPVCKTAGSIPR